MKYWRKERRLCEIGGDNLCNSWRGVTGGNSKLQQIIVLNVTV
jgi:hypothetical protein